MTQDKRENFCNGKEGSISPGGRRKGGGTKGGLAHEWRTFVFTIARKRTGHSAIGGGG